MKNLNEYAMNLVESEGLKYQVSIAQIKEMIKLVAMDLSGDPELISTLIEHGLKHKRPKEERKRRKKKVEVATQDPDQQTDNDASVKEFEGIAEKV